MTLSHSEDHTECEEWLRSVHMKKRWLLSRAQRWDQREVHDELNMCWAEWFKAAYTRMIAVELGEEARKAGAGVTGLGCLGRHWKCQAEHQCLFCYHSFGVPHGPISGFWGQQEGSESSTNKQWGRNWSFKDVFSVAISVAGDSYPS